MKLIMGTMTFGPQVNPDDSQKMIDYFLKSGNVEIDTAYVYNKGDSELFLGSILKSYSRDQYSIATKVNPRITGKLDAKAVNMQLEESLNRLQLDYVDTLYLHFPDPNIPLVETLDACANLYDKGKFKELGLSNFPAWMVADAWHICRKNSWPLPSIYQGLYNGLSRQVEEELLLAIRQFGLRFYAYNPLAGGILSGKYTNFSSPPSLGRFTFRPNYKERYWKKSFFDALNLLTSVCNKYDIGMAEAAYRWLAFHSQLDREKSDGILIGASRMEQLIQNVEALNCGKLPQELLEAFESAWQASKADSPPYFKFNVKKL